MRCIETPYCSCERGSNERLIETWDVLKQYKGGKTYEANED